MKNRAPIDLLLIMATYALYWAFIYSAYTYDLPGEMGVIPVHGITGSQFREQFNDWSLIIMGVSLFAVIAWYVLGEWGLRAHRTASGIWIVIWICLLALVVVSAFAAQFLGPQASDNPTALALFFFGGGIVFYWLATALFSPISIKHEPPLAKYLRRW